ncbi:MAG: DUF3369 domain-containing protein [Spirochaetales bacterium]|nr:DUF3369 domain-containing protein [Spirochaetales bacterium]
MDDELIFADENENSENLGPRLNFEDTWKILIVDDEQEVHNVTKMVLGDLVYKNKKAEFFHAYSAEDTLEIVKKNPDIAIILLDVVMEEDNTGLRLIKAIREELGNKFVRIVIRTGQPGEAPEKKVIVDYDINDYKEKTELTSQKLFSTIIASLRSFENIMILDRNRQGLAKIIQASSQLLEFHSINSLGIEILTQLQKLINEGFQKNELISGFVAGLEKDKYKIISGIGDYSGKIEIDDKAAELIQLAKNNYVNHFFKKGYYIGLFRTLSGEKNIILIRAEKDLDQSDQYLIEILCSHIQSVYDNIYLSREIEDTQKEILFTLGEVVETRSNETGYHVKRVAEYSKLLALKYGLSEAEAELIKQASPMHDIGKVGINDEILNKPGELTKAEFEVIKTHAKIGYDIFKSSNRKILKAAAIIAHQHHERYDGTGYPNGLKGENIHIYGRITCLTDVFDALDSNRVYKKAWPFDRILDYIKSEKGKLFDPRLVDIFFENIEEIKKIRESYSRAY